MSDSTCFIYREYMWILEATMSFRWPETLAKEVAKTMPEKPMEWDKIGSVEIKGRGCRERMDHLLEKHKNDDTKALKR